MYNNKYVLHFKFDSSAILCWYDSDSNKYNIRHMKAIQNNTEAIIFSA